MNKVKSYFEIGIMAHNEEQNIGFLLGEFLKQAQDTKLPFYITVVASGCTDKTEDIVINYKNKDNRVKLLVEKQRTGKARAINLFLNQSMGDLLVISSADILLTDNTLKQILNAFYDSSIGMVGVHSIPKNSIGIIGSLNKLLWELHHEIALSRPKLGELIALRNIINRIPEYTAADEASVEAIVTQKGLKIKYLPETIIYNYKPKSLNSFIKKRIRIFVGHIYVKKMMSYQVSTYSVFILISAILRKVRRERKNMPHILILIFLEAYARITAFLNYYLRNKTYHIWYREDC